MRKLEADALRVLHGFADDVIRKRRQELMENQNRAENDHENGGGDDGVGARKKRALLDILLHSTIDDKPLSDLDIREEVDVFMFKISTIFFVYLIAPKSFTRLFLSFLCYFQVDVFMFGVSEHFGKFSITKIYCPKAFGTVFSSLVCVCFSLFSGPWHDHLSHFICFV